MIARAHASLGILAGGRGSRLGGTDKAFVEIDGIPLLRRVITAAGPGWAHILASHNRPEDPRRRGFEQEGIVFVADAMAAGEGPLAGLDALLHACENEWLLTLPVDVGDPSTDVVDRLLCTQGAVLRDADGPQPLFALWHVPSARGEVRQVLESGERAVQGIAPRLGLPTVDWSPRRLGNLNTPEDFRTRP